MREQLIEKLQAARGKYHIDKDHLRDILELYDEDIEEGHSESHAYDSAIETLQVIIKSSKSDD